MRKSFSFYGRRSLGCRIVITRRWIAARLNVNIVEGERDESDMIATNNRLHLGDPEKRDDKSR